MVNPAARDWLDRPALARLWDGLHARLQNNGLVVRGNWTLEDPTDEERAELELLMGRTYARPRITIKLADLDRRLPDGLIDTVQELRGALTDKPAVRINAQRERELLWSNIRAEAAAADLASLPWTDAWLAELRQTGSLARLDSDSALSLAVQACSVLALLTGPPLTLGRNELAERVTGSAHGLDDNTLLSRIVLRGLAHVHETDVPKDARMRRELWELAGAPPDAISATVLTYGLYPGGDDLSARTLRMRLGAETHLTRRDLSNAHWRVPRGIAVHVCENPRVLQAAAEAGVGGPLICTSGNANTTVIALLDLLAADDVDYRFRGDFDWPGIAMVNRLLARYSARPWRMSAFDYESHAASARDRGTPLNPLAGRPVTASWDPELAPAMHALDVTVEEESALDLLLSDLR
jgi:uncharacterized protein (TIGR02679 family)